MELGLSPLIYPHSSVIDGIEVANNHEISNLEIILDTPSLLPGFDSSSLEEAKELLKDYGLNSRVHGYFWDLNPVSI